MAPPVIGTSLIGSPCKEPPSPTKSPGRSTSTRLEEAMEEEKEDFLWVVLLGNLAGAADQISEVEVAGVVRFVGVNAEEVGREEGRDEGRDDKV